MKPLADQIEAIALGMERGELPERRASVRLREIAEKVRELEQRGYVPDETQAPYIVGELPQAARCPKCKSLLCYCYLREPVDD